MWRRTSVVHVVDELTRSQRRERARADLETLLLGFLWGLWGVRLELALALAAFAIQRSAAVVFGDTGGIIVVLIAVVGAVGVRPARRFLVRLLHAMRVRRAWARAAIDSGVAAGP